MTTASEFTIEDETVSAILAPYRDVFPADSDYEGYRNHCLRMMNVVLKLSDDAPNRLEKLRIAVAFHDLSVFPKRTLDYLDDSSELAAEYLNSIDRPEWEEEISSMINNHHKLTRYRGEFENLVEPFRKADWIDVTLGHVRFGLERDWVVGLHKALPLYTFYPRTMLKVIFGYVLRNPLAPLPNFKM
ncbi:MAG: HD domain-containing protein [Planctomycetota bacterium]